MMAFIYAICHDNSVQKKNNLNLNFMFKQTSRKKKDKFKLNMELLLTQQ